MEITITRKINVDEIYDTIISLATGNTSQYRYLNVDGLTPRIATCETGSLDLLSDIRDKKNLKYERFDESKEYYLKYDTDALHWITPKHIRVPFNEQVMKESITAVLNDYQANIEGWHKKIKPYQSITLTFAEESIKEYYMSDYYTLTYWKVATEYKEKCDELFEIEKENILINNNNAVRYAKYIADKLDNVNEKLLDICNNLPASISKSLKNTLLSLRADTSYLTKEQFKLDRRREHQL